MKAILLLLTSCILFTSCFSYKNIDIASTNILIGKKYKIETLDSVKIKAKVISVSDNSLSLQKKETQTEIPFSEIETIKIRKFSYLKTAGVFVVSVVSIFLLTFKVDSKYSN